MKDETGGIAIEEFVGLKPKMHWLLVNDSREHKKAKGIKKNVVARISHSEYKDVSLNNKSLRHFMNRIHIKNHKIRTYKINKVSLSCFDDKIYPKQWIWWLALGYWSFRVDYKRGVNLITIQNSFFCHTYCKNILIFALVRTVFLSSYKNILIFAQVRTAFFSLCKMVDSENSSDNYNKSWNAKICS